KYGNKDNPNKGLYITGVDITISNGSITKISQEQKELKNFILPNNPGTTININGDDKVIPIAILNAVKDSNIGYLRVNNWSSNTPGDRAAGLVGLSTGETEIHHITNLSNMLENKAGVVGIGAGKTIIQFNVNKGNMVVGTTNDLHSAGIVLIGSGNTLVQHNTTYGNTRGLSGGIVLESYNFVIVRRNYNKSTSVYQYSGAIVFESFNESNIIYNFNKASLGSLCAGTVRISHDSSKIEYNWNEGELFWGSHGIVFKSYDNSQIKFNKNTGLFSGNFANGIIGEIHNSSSVIGNINISHVKGYSSGPIAGIRLSDAVVNNNYWQIHNDPADRYLRSIYFNSSFTQTNGGALTRQELIDRGLI
ncbi:MAG: hypothetical protein HRT87_07470, partial [Legionellales bacterium]|nr:hypothetical protein [Legionellales bacterium]